MHRQQSSAPLHTLGSHWNVTSSSLIAGLGGIRTHTPHFGGRAPHPPCLSTTAYSGPHTAESLWATMEIAVFVEDAIVCTNTMPVAIFIGDAGNNNALLDVWHAELLVVVEISSRETEVIRKTLTSHVIGQSQLLCYSIFIYLPRSFPFLLPSCQGVCFQYHSIINLASIFGTFSLLHFHMYASCTTCMYTSSNSNGVSPDIKDINH